MVFRFSLLIGILILAYAVLAFHISQIQLVKGGYYLARAESEYLAAGLFNPDRGTIYFTDKDGSQVPIAINKQFPLVYAVPKVIEDPEEAANALAPILKQNSADILKKLSKKNDSYEELIKKADSETVDGINNLGIKGIYMTDVPLRFYPQGVLSSQVLGFVGPSKSSSEESGHYGVEEFYNEMLEGAAGGTVDGKTAASQNGADLALTIDPNIEIEAERVLTDLVKSSKSLSGSVIVEDPMTGKILAMGSTPSFDPNSYGSSDLKNFLNPAIQGTYEPGSVFKILTMAIGLDAKKITPDTTFYDTGNLVLNGKKIQNWDLKAHGRVTMTNVIEQSINTGAAFAERQIGDPIFTEYLKKFGLSEKTGIDLPGEVAGDLRTLHPKASAITFATASFGQGVTVTPLGLINAVSALANGGNLMRPYVNAAMSPRVIRRVVSGSAADQATQMMVSAVDKAEIGRVNGYSIAGKTGTAQVPIKGGYSNDLVVDTYVGFGPTSNPKFIILVKIDEPQGAPLAGLTVVPAFRSLAQFLLNYYNVPPDRTGANSAMAQ